MRKPIKFLILGLAILAGYLSLIFFLGDPGKGLLSNELPQDIILRKNFLIRVLNNGPSQADFFQGDTSQFAGEWTIGTYAMATYALTNMVMFEPKTALESSQIISRWIEFCMRPKIYSFDTVAWDENSLDDKVLAEDRGHIGYYAHLNLMLGCYALLNNDGRFQELHRKLSDAIARRMAKYPHRHIETYPHETYPPDNTVAAASLRVADMTLGVKYKTLVDEWVEQSKRLEQSPAGLIAFQIDSESGIPLQTYRGSNIAWNSFFMPLVDENYAKDQFEKFKQNMLRRITGFAAFREYPKGGLFRMDCDTGPVILGLGGTATGFSVAGARWTDDKDLLSSILRSVEILGMSVTKGDARRYLAVPVVGDAIMLAMKTAGKWRPRYGSERNKKLAQKT
jgi:hypothetical protein